MAKKKTQKKSNKDEYIPIDEVEYADHPEEPTESVKLEVFRTEKEEEKKKVSPFSRAFTGLNIALFIIAAVLMGLAFLERGKTILDLVAAFVFIVVMIKIMLDGYGINILGGEQ